MKTRVLIVDDDLLVRNAVRRTLSAVAHVRLASGFEDACAKLRLDPYDIVLTDESMPDGSGRCLLAFVLRYFPDCRRWLMSGNGEPSPSCQEPDTPHERFFRKPFASDVVRALVQER